MSSNVSKILIPDESINIVNLVSVCLSEDIDINSIKDASGNTLLHIAVENMNIGVIEFLLKCNNVNTEIFNYFYEFPLDIAIKNGYLDIVKMFLVEGIDVNLSRNGKESFLYSAVKFRRLDIIEILCSYGANIDDRCSFGVEEGFTPLMLASKLGDQAIVFFLKNNGADINAESANKTTALYHAVEENHVDMVKLLLEWGANTAVINKSAIEHKFTPLHVACKNGSQEIVKLLLENKVEVNAQAWHNKTPLHLAIQYQHLNVVQFLLYYGADTEALCNTWAEEKLTPLHLACEHKNSKIVLALLNKKVNINTVFVGGYTALYLAILNRNLNSAQLLLERGAKADNMIAHTLLLTWRFTLLIIACQKRFSLVVKLLLSNVVNEDHIGQTWTPSKTLSVTVNNEIIHLARDPENDEFYTCNQIEELINVAAKEQPSITVTEKQQRSFILNYLNKYLSALKLQQ